MSSGLMKYVIDSSENFLAATYFIYLFLVGLGFELRALCWQSNSTTA
jgi:hypothetical protein